MKSSHCRRTKLNGLRFSSLAIAGLIGFQVTLVEAGHAQSTPAIPEAQPTPSPTAASPGELPHRLGTAKEFRPLIPQPGNLHSPTRRPAPAPPLATRAVAGSQTDK